MGHVETSDCPGRTHLVACEWDCCKNAGRDGRQRRRCDRDEPAAQRSGAELMDQEDEAEQAQRNETSTEPATSSETAAQSVRGL